MNQEAKSEIIKISGIPKSKTGEKLLTSALILFLTLQAHNKAKAEDSVKQLEPITNAMDMYRGDRWNQSLIAQYYNILNPENKNKYKHFGIPNSIGLSGDGSLPENADMFKKFDITKVPTYIINGNYDKSQYSADISGLRLISEGVQNTPQLANFKLTKLEKMGQYTMEVTGKDELKKYKNLGLNVIAFQENVNCPSQDLLRTTILERVAKQYVFNTGIGFTLGKDLKFSKNISLNIHESIQPNTIIVAYVFDKDTNKFLASAFTEMVEGEHAIFKVDNSLPKCTVDLKDIAKYTGLDHLALKLPNLPEYIDKTGYKKKTFSVEKVKDLASLSLEFDYTSTEAEIYDFLTAGLPKELEGKATLKFDKNTKKVELKFPPEQPYNGSGELFNYYIKINKPTINGVNNTKINAQINSVNCKIKNLIAIDSKGNSIKYEMPREQKNFSPVRMVTEKNKFNINNDDRKDEVNEQDYREFLFSWGTEEKDPAYDPKCDFNNDKRVNFPDWMLLMGEMNEQERMKKEIKAIDPTAIPNTRETEPAKLASLARQNKPKSMASMFNQRQFRVQSR